MIQLPFQFQCIPEAILVKVFPSNSPAQTLNYTLSAPCELKEHLQCFVSYYNHERYQGSLNNLTPADEFLDGIRKYTSKVL